MTQLVTKSSDTLIVPPHPAAQPRCKLNLVSVLCVAVAVLFLIVIMPFAVTIWVYRKIKAVGRELKYFCTGARDVALVIQAIDDHNGAFNSRAFALGRLRKRYLHIDRFAGKITDVIDAINSISPKDRIKVLWLRAHGQPQAIQLGQTAFENDSCVFDDNWLHFGNIERLREPLKKLTPDASIVLECCSSGLSEAGVACIAKKIAALTPGRTVHAVTKPRSFWQASISFDPLSIHVPPYPDFNRPVTHLKNFICYTLHYLLGINASMSEVTVAYRV